ncbi:MAG: helicase C-terminal domain-containing protein [Planctomycetota bacterium]|nr:helicase C-terminal domain-containing protein [Planctomycetota bacterium]
MRELIEDILCASGSVAAALGEAYEHRPQQVRMAHEVAATMHAGAHLLAEAGTGVGKSFAYLVPAMIRAALYGETVVIATNTIALQEQLIGKDIPFLASILQRDDRLTKAAPEPALVRPIKAVLVKGRGNYVSIRRLGLAVQRQDRLVHDEAGRRSLRVIQDWAATTRDGTLSSLPPLERGAVWDYAVSDSGNCMGRKCPNFRDCFYQRARREMADANVLVCNHALFFSDLALRVRDASFLPQYQHVVLDEAHNVEDAASEHFGCSLAEGRVNHLLTTLYQPRSGKGFLGHLSGLAAGDLGQRNTAIARVVGAMDAARVFFESLRNVVRESGREGGSGLRVREPGVVENLLGPAMGELSLALRGLKESVPLEADKFELNSYAQRAADIALAAETLVDQKLPACAYWIEVAGYADAESARGARTARVTLACSPVEVGPILAQHLFGDTASVVLTSATLATAGLASRATTRPRSAPEVAPEFMPDAASDFVPDLSAHRGNTSPDLPGHDADGDNSQGDGHNRGEFEHAMERLGCRAARTLKLGSPFDYARQVEFFVEGDAPNPRGSFHRRGRGGHQPSIVRHEAGSRGRFDPASHAFPDGSSPDSASSSDGASGGGFSASLARRVLSHLDATDGGAFVLFTSFASLYALADELRQPLLERGMPMLAQGRDGSRSLILERFRSNERSVLLGAASFWQGVDVRGNALRNVIITKLPFDPPDRPLTEARGEFIQARGGDPFREDALPRAIIRFKQGFGRLIRSASDRGRVVCLDPRVLTTAYGGLFLAALPPGVTPRRA